MNPLNLNDAYRLYLVLKPHLPQETNLNYDTMLPHIIQSVSSSGKYMDLVEALAILNNTNSDTILKDLDASDTLYVLMQGFSVNRFIELVDFFRGYN